MGFLLGMSTTGALDVPCPAPAESPVVAGAPATLERRDGDRRDLVRIPAASRGAMPAVRPPVHDCLPEEPADQRRGAGRARAKRSTTAAASLLARGCPGN